MPRRRSQRRYYSEDYPGNPGRDFDSYLTQFRRRFKLRIIVTAIAAVIFSVLTVSLLTAVLKDTLADSNWLYYPARAALVILPIVLFIAILWKPYQRFKKSAGADELESAVPGFDGRVDTYLDMKRRKVDSPFVDLLAKDASRAAAKAPVKKIVPTSEVMGPVFASVGMLALAGWLFTSLPLDWRASMKQLWMGWFVSDILPDRSIAIAPGDTKIRIGDSLFVTATLDGFDSGTADLQVRQINNDNTAFEKVSMTPEADGSFSFTLYGVSEPIEYYVSAAFTDSERANVEVVTPARITAISHEYFYPEWTGTEQAIFDEATSISAVAGTRVEITFQTDKPLENAAALHDDIEIAAAELAENTYMASITLEKDGSYSLIDLQEGSQIPLSPSHDITILEDVKPTVAFNLPGGDWSATPIEEVAVAVEAKDDFAIETVTLNYSVNGAAWEQIPLNEDNNFEHLFMLEEFYSETGSPLLAGDLISYYAEATDREQTVSTDMMFIDVRPFERRFTQSQQSGGGGGGGGQQQEQEISQRQKEILVATFNLIRESKSEESALIDPADTATLLSDLQSTLADQANKLAQRAEARQLLNEDPDVARFVEFMLEAAESMQPSADALARLSFEEAVQHQQRALQFLKRAESIFNDITVNQNNSNGGGGGGASQDMQEMYELEMDLAKNQYETPDSVPEDNPQQAGSDEAFDKLKELAERQQQLADAAAGQEQMSEADRWQQEKLRRELEELQAELEQLQRDQQASNQQQAQQGQQGEQDGQQGSQQSGQQSDQQSQNSNASPDGESQQAMQALQEAIDELKRVEENAANMTPEERQQAMQSASEKLRQSLEQTADERQQELQQQLADATDAVRDLSQRQQQTSEALREAMRRAMEARKENRFESGLDRQQEQRLAETKRQMQQELESIRDDLADTSKRFAEQAPLTTERLEQAIDELDRNQVAEMMGTSGDMIEEGMAPQAALREERINNALRNLQTDLFESASLAAAETGLNDDSEATVADATRAVQQLRQALAEALNQNNASEGGEQVAELQQIERGQGSDNQSGQEQGQDQSQNQSENQGQGEGQEQGEGQGDGQGEGQSDNNTEGQQGQGQQGQGNQSGQQGQNGSSGNSPSSSSSGRLGGNSTWGPTSGEATESDVPINNGQAQLIEESIRQLQGLTDSPLDGLSEQTMQDLNALTEEIKIGSDAENNRRIEANVKLLLRQLEQLELQIYNESKDIQVTRSKQRIADPDGFDNQTADYFRRLSEPTGS